MRTASRLLAQPELSFFGQLPMSCGIFCFFLFSACLVFLVRIANGSCYVSRPSPIFSPPPSPHGFLMWLRWLRYASPSLYFLLPCFFDPFSALVVMASGTRQLRRAPVCHNSLHLDGSLSSIWFLFSSFPLLPPAGPRALIFSVSALYFSKLFFHCFPVFLYPLFLPFLPHAHYPIVVLNGLLPLCLPSVFFEALIPFLIPFPPFCCCPWPSLLPLSSVS